MPLTEDDVLTALKDCYDPEIPVNIVDLGLIYTVKVTPDANSKRAFPRQRVEVDMTMTSQGCPAHVSIMEQVRNRLAGVPEISETVVKATDTVWVSVRSTSVKAKVPLVGSLLSDTSGPPGVEVPAANSINWVCASLVMIGWSLVPMIVSVTCCVVVSGLGA